MHVKLNHTTLVYNVHHQCYRYVIFLVPDMRNLLYFCWFVRVAPETSKAILAVRDCLLELEVAPVADDTMYFIHWLQKIWAGYRQRTFLLWSSFCSTSRCYSNCHTKGGIQLSYLAVMPMNHNCDHHGKVLLNIQEWHSYVLVTNSCLIGLNPSSRGDKSCQLLEI